MKSVRNRLLYLRQIQKCGTITVLVAAAHSGLASTSFLFLHFQLAGLNQTNSQGDWQLPGDGIWPSAALGLSLVSQNRFWFGIKPPLLSTLFLLGIIHSSWPSAFQDVSDWLKKHLIFFSSALIKKRVYGLCLSGSLSRRAQASHLFDLTCLHSAIPSGQIREEKLHYHWVWMHNLCLAQNFQSTFCLKESGKCESLIKPCMLEKKLRGGLCL